MARWRVSCQPLSDARSRTCRRPPGKANTSGPVDGREVAGEGELVVEAPEHFHDAERGLHDRFREVAAGRRHGADEQSDPLYRRCPDRGRCKPARRNWRCGSRDRRDSLPRRAFLRGGPTFRAWPRPAAVESAMRATEIPMSRKYSAMVMPVNTLASRAATGMFEVLAISTVRSMRVRPNRGPSVREFHQRRSSRCRVRRIHVDDDLGVGPLGELVLHHGLPLPNGPGTHAVPASSGKTCQSRAGRLSWAPWAAACV